MPASKNTYKSARAVGAGDWNKVIELEQEELLDDPENQHALSMIGFAYKRKGDLETAKEYYAQALAIDNRCTSALEDLARIYATEKNHDIAYDYVLKGLNLPEEVDYGVPKIVKYFLVMVLKIWRPTAPISAIYERVKKMDRGRSEWKEWAMKYKEWYEMNVGNSSESKLH